MNEKPATQSPTVGTTKTAETTVEPTAETVATEQHTLPSLGGVHASRPQDVNKRMTVLLWADAGVGKTTLAATAPGRKLWYNFDPDGTNTLAGIGEDIEHYDLSANTESVLDLFKNDTNPLNIKSVLDHFDTFVFDSITNVVDKTLQRGI